ncbi:MULTISPECIES: MFS transporter [unclassified Paenibacillus]|uniref:MFS transporter n=1 Tax=unclassified Paenibacillus TaxID=185978 RepID=UPI0009A74167|nr:MULTISPECIES: MFS transporter [unclassified Paenibacillus]SLK10937.1 Predicted arabinose efflux permease, MFS family [Paenibacillus sp. RU5A]SOC72116.1 Predicted arabinose efflux permease, MFS family [Paenibacillus sp. RU26A]SOC74462.1 Predicted arabinose efflux permease, MFS family [Paenibacillus sp. RU5M]
MNIAFYPYWAAKTLLSLINVIYIMVITTFIYGQTGSVLYAALFPFIQMSARIVAGFTAPLLVNRFAFSRLIISIPLAKTLMITGIAIAFTDLTAHIPLLLVGIAILSFLDGWESPLINTLTPRLVQGEDLVKANSFLSFSTQTVTIIGYAMTGFIVMHWGASQTFWAATSLSWAVLLLMITISSLTRDMQEKVEKSTSRWDVLREGWLILWKNRSLRLITFMDLVEGLAGSIWIGAITLAFVKEALGQEKGWWGLINSSYSAGTILGGILAIALATRIQKHLISSMAIGSLLFSLLTIAYGLNSLPWLALVLCMLMGPAYQIRDIAQQTAFQTSVPIESLSKVNAAHGIILSASMSISTVIFGLIADQMGIRLVYLIGGALFIVSSLCSFRLNRIKEQND